jgi:hypothetical protein
MKTKLFKTAASVPWIAGVVFFVIAGTPPARAQDRAGLFGQSLMIPYRVEPNAERGDETYSLDLGYSFDEHWLGMLSWDLGMRGIERTGISVGPNYLMKVYSRFKPYVGLRFLYSIAPSNEIGWRVLVGIEWNARRWTGVDNLRFSFDTGISGYLFDAGPNEYNFEVIRMGVSWSF